MIDPRIAWFAMGATFGLVLCGWPWHPRFSRYSRPAATKPSLPPPPAPEMHRVHIYSPATMAECGGPCCEAWDPRACTCGQLWFDVPLPPEMDPRFGEPWDGPIPPLAQRGHAPDWRRSFTHENHNAPSGPPPLNLQRSGELGPSSLPLRHDEGPTARSNNGSGPTTPKPDIIPKPQFPSPRVIPGDTP